MSVQLTEAQEQSFPLFSSSNGNLEELIRTNRELHAVVLELKELLADPARHASYHSVPQQVSSAQQLGCRNSSLENTDIPKTSTKTPVEAVAGDLVPYSPATRLDFTKENELARQRHEQRRTSEMLRLKHWIDYKYISLPPTFYQREIEAYDRSERFNVIDPFHWWSRLQKHLPHYHDRISKGHRTNFGNTSQYRDELLDALFDFESTWPENLVQTLPLRELEHSYGYKLHSIKDTSGKSRPSTELIIEVGRFFRELFKDMRKHAYDAHSAEAIKKTYTLTSLYERCKERDGAIQEYADSEKQRTLYLGRIWNVLRCLNHVAVMPEELPTPVDDIMDLFILEMLDRLYVRGATPRSMTAPRPDESLHFSPKELCLKTLTELGGLKIAWTNLYTQHLRLIRSSKTLLLFWDVSILGQSPLFTHWPQWPDETTDAAPLLHSYSTISTGLFKELQRSYRIIFGNPDGRFLDRFFRKHFHRYYDDDVGVVLHDLEMIMLGAPRVRVDISRSSVREALKYYLRASIPPSILSLRPELDQKKHRGPTRRHNWHIFHNYNLWSMSFRRRTSGKLLDLLNAGPPYPLDFWMHISCLLELSRSTNLDGMEKYSSYPIFGQRLRELHQYMEKQRPKNLRQLWKDRRDTVGFWAFWAVVAVGGLSILLALISIAISSAQVVAGFRAIGHPISGANSTTTS